MDQNNLIRFPVEKVKNKKSARQDLHLKISFSPLDQRQRLGFVLSVMTVIVLSLYFMPMAGQKSQTKDGRFLASIDDIKESQLQEELLKVLRQPVKVMTHIGRKPTSEDRLRDETLKSRYRIVYDRRFIREISLPQSEDLYLKPVDIGDRLAFLQRYKELFFSSVQKIEPAFERSGASLRDEVYVFYSGKQKVGKAYIKLDRAGHLFSLKTEQYN